VVEWLELVCVCLNVLCWLSSGSPASPNRFTVVPQPSSPLRFNRLWAQKIPAKAGWLCRRLQVQISPEDDLKSQEPEDWLRERDLAA